MPSTSDEAGFARATVSLSPGMAVTDVVAHVQRLVQPRGHVHFTPCTPQAASFLPLRAEAEQDLAAVTAWVGQVVASLTEAGFHVDAGEDDPTAGLALLARDAPLDQVARHLEAGRSVALVRDSPGPGPVGLLALADLRQARAAVPVLRKVASHQEIHLISLRDLPQGTANDLQAVLGWAQPLHLHELSGGMSEAFSQVRALLDRLDLGLLIAPTSSSWSLRPILYLTSSWQADLLFVPGGAPLSALTVRWAAFTAVPLAHAVVTAVVLVDPAGMTWSPPDGPCALVRAGAVVAHATLDKGRLEVALGGLTEATGLATDPDHAQASLQVVVHTAVRDGAPIVLVPVDVHPSALSTLVGEGRRAWAVAVAPCDPDEVRTRLGIDTVLLAGAVLQDGLPSDVPGAASALTFDRVARALRAQGYPVALSVCPVGGAGYAHLRPSTLAQGVAPEAVAVAIDEAFVPAVRGSVFDALRARCDARPSCATTLSWLTDNREARERTLALIDGARERLHLQTFMFEDDPCSRGVAAALARAGARGVTVRVLVDSLWSLHGSLTRENAVLTELAGHAGVQVQAWRPVEELVDLKRRNHRKLVIADGARALIHGRNLAGHYLTAFDEVVLDPTTDQDGVPWIDLSTEVTGPVVREVDDAFLGSWVESGGEPFEPVPASTATGIPVWWVTHASLHDTTTLDAMRVLIDHARHQVTLVNTFALQHELQHALLACLARGVAVRFLTGHVRPRFQGGDLPFPGSPTRDFATEIIHGRLDVLARAGAQVWACAVAPQPDWDPEVGTVLPHVHAKLVSVDGELAAVGSANVDISSAYWESEVMLLVADPTHVARIDSWVDALCRAGVPFDPADADWQRRAGQRAWISEHWPAFMS